MSETLTREEREAAERALDMLDPEKERERRRRIRMDIESMREDSPDRGSRDWMMDQVLRYRGGGTHG